MEIPKHTRRVSHRSAELQLCAPRAHRYHAELELRAPCGRAGVRASVFSDFIFGVGGSVPLVFFKVSLLTSAATIPLFLESTLDRKHEQRKNREQQQKQAQRVDLRVVAIVQQVEYAHG